MNAPNPNFPGSNLGRGHKSGEDLEVLEEESRLLSVGLGLFHTGRQTRAALGEVATSALSMPSFGLTSTNVQQLGTRHMLFGFNFTVSNCCFGIGL